VVVDRYYFPATLGYFADPSVAVALFAIPQDLTVDARPQIKVEDRVGNARLVALPCRIRDRSFPERAFNIDDAFLARKVPELEGLNKLTPKPDLVEGYLFINGPFRRETEARLDKLTARSVGRPLWDGGFRRQSNAANMSAFADRRVYMHDGREIDRQTHLGYDLASLEGATIEATQNGVVVFADDLGIYGGTVVLDHGLGVFSLYGHLRSISVKPGQEVKSGEGVGQSGETGLAGGDHLHFSIMIHGTHVDPVEWWDPKWIKDHVTEKLTMLPLAAQTAAPGTTANEPRRP
jgi:murein DD-endopeptidase MepM/ murein hydrolase activator NlpD